MAVQHVNEADFEEKVVKSKLPVLVDFWAEWCGPCRMAEPVLEELAQEYQDKVEILKLNVDENQEISAKFGVMSIPTIIAFKAGEEVERKIGFGGKSGYEELIKKVVD